MLPRSDFMQDPENGLLWNKIQQFKFDTAGSVITFAGKLAAQNNWTARFTESVIEEYRKFIFLCCISPTGASPSLIVDEAWHLHLTYTQSYWTDLCKNTLGRDLHHYPTKGGEVENRKHQKWYKETLWFYVRVFEAAPPADIWPTPKKNPVETNVPGYLLMISNKLHVAFVFCLFFLSVAGAYNSVFPFNLDGPQFLIFYALLGTALIVLNNTINKRTYNKVISFIQNQFPNDVNVFQMAAFVYGKDRAIKTGIVDLVRKGFLKPQGNKKFIISNAIMLPDEQNPFAASLYTEEDGKEIEYHEISKQWFKNENFEHADLEKIKRFIPFGSNLQFYLLIGVLIVGFTRVIQGIINDKPSSFLLIEIVILFIIVIFIHIFNAKPRVFNQTAHSIYNNRFRLYGQEYDKVVTEFGMTGRSAITGFEDGLLLAGIFSINTPYTSAAADGGGGGGCSGGGDGGGGSCGGGCSGGCGGGG